MNDALSFDKLPYSMKIQFPLKIELESVDCTIMVGVHISGFEQFKAYQCSTIRILLVSENRYLEESVDRLFIHSIDVTFLGQWKHRLVTKPWSNILDTI